MSRLKQFMCIIFTYSKRFKNLPCPNLCLTLMHLSPTSHHHFPLCISFKTESVILHHITTVQVQYFFSLKCCVTAGVQRKLLFPLVATNTLAKTWEIWKITSQLDLILVVIAQLRILKRFFHNSQNNTQYWSSGYNTTTILRFPSNCTMTTSFESLCLLYIFRDEWK